MAVRDVVPHAVEELDASAVAMLVHMRKVFAAAMAA